jgi:hypothetical protein
MVLFAMRIASSAVSKAIADSTGPKISSRAMLIEGCTPAQTVGATKRPRSVMSRLPPSRSVAPCRRPSST